MYLSTEQEERRHPQTGQKDTSQQWLRILLQCFRKRMSDCRPSSFLRHWSKEAFPIRAPSPTKYWSLDHSAWLTFKEPPSFLFASPSAFSIIWFLSQYHKRRFASCVSWTTAIEQRGNDGDGRAILKCPKPSYRRQSAREFLSKGYWWQSSPLESRQTWHCHRAGPRFNRHFSSQYLFWAIFYLAVQYKHF